MTKFYIQNTTNDEYEEVTGDIYCWCARYSGLVDFEGGDFSTSIFNGKMEIERGSQIDE